MDDEELQLPALPQSMRNPKLPRAPFLRLSSRKRSTRSDELQSDDALSNSMHTSSDPALFSSDETPDAENYSGAKRRKKKTYAGTWWGDKAPKITVGKRELRSNRNLGIAGKTKFTRNFDSGIFMNSDDGSTELSSDSSFGQELLEEQARLKEQKDNSRTPTTPKGKPTFLLSDLSPRTPRAIRTPVVRDTKEQYVVSIVRKCLEESKEDVDLSDMMLESLPLEIRELATMVKDDPATPLLFESLVARPRLYLSNNLLRHFPTPVLQLSNLRLLSLRQNKLTQLPTGIRNLVKLETLNISGNKLQSLPMEVLVLASNHHLRELHSEPNPWLTPTEEQKETNKRTRHRGRLAGSGIENPARHHFKDFTFTATTDVEQMDRVVVPPLTEMVLRQLSKLNNSKKDLTPLMPDDTPKTVMAMLGHLDTSQNEGDRQCAWCNRSFVIAARRWIEWWDLHDMTGVQNQKVALSHPTKHHILPFDVAICGGCA